MEESSPRFSLPFRRRSNSAVAGGMQVPQAASKKRRRLWLAAFFFIVTALCGYLDRQDIRGFGFAYFDQYFYNVATNFSARRNRDLWDWAKQQIVIVQISDYTFSPENPDHLSEGPPTPRYYHAKVLSELKRAGAKVITYDIVFTKPSPHDEKFIRAAQTGGRQLVWGALVDEGDQDDGMPSTMLPIPPLLRASPYFGNTASVPDERLVVQSMRSVYQRGAQTIPALSVQTARLALGLQNEPIKKTAHGWQMGRLQIPETFNIQYLTEKGVAEDSNFETITFKPSSTRANGSVKVVASFPTVPFEQLYAGAANDLFYKDYFKNKIVIVGDVTTISNDFRSTPVGLMAGVQIQAHAIATLLMADKGTRALSGPISAQLRFGILLTITALTCFLAIRFSLLRAVLSVAGLVAAYLVTEIYLYTDHCLILPTTAPLLAATLVSISVLMERGFWEEREKNYMRSMLGRYVSPSVANYMLLHPERFNLGGESIEATVLFADIRNFTSISQQLSPDVTLQLLNDYFRSMSEIVFAHNGMVDKFIGDAIMAIFGAPMTTPDHALQAFSAAIEMQKRIGELQEQWQAQGLPEIRIGIGIASGPMIVGNMGSDTRTDFSAVGNAVNLAARLQDMNKELGTHILISEGCQQALPVENPHVKVSDPIQVTVRGHQTPENVYTVEPPTS